MLPVPSIVDSADAEPLVVGGGHGGPIARPQQGLPARRLGQGFVEPQQLPRELRPRRPAARRARRRRRRRGPAAIPRRAPRDCWAVRPPESASPRGTKPAAVRRPIALRRQRPARGSRPAAGIARPIGPAFPRGRWAAPSRSATRDHPNRPPPRAVLEGRKMDGTKMTHGYAPSVMGSTGRMAFFESHASHVIAGGQRPPES